jgi:hypothetical protein
LQKYVVDNLKRRKSVQAQQREGRRRREGQEGEGQLGEGLGDEGAQREGKKKKEPKAPSVSVSELLNAFKNYSFAKGPDAIIERLRDK